MLDMREYNDTEIEARSEILHSDVQIARLLAYIRPKASSIIHCSNSEYYSSTQEDGSWQRSGTQ